jgi:hypothetical protein
MPLTIPELRTAEAIKEILRERIEGWHAYSGIPLEGEQEALHNADHQAVETITRLSSNGFGAAMAKLVIAKGASINYEMSLGVFCDRIEAEAVAAGLDHFGLRELYDRYFLGKPEAASC